LFALTAFVAPSTACRDDDFPSCFGGSLEQGDRLAVRIRNIHPSEGFYIDGGMIPSCATIGFDEGSTLYLDVQEASGTYRCIGFSASVEPPSALAAFTASPHPHPGADGSDDREINGYDDVMSANCGGTFSLELGFAGGLPIGIPGTANVDGRQGTAATLGFTYSTGPLVGKEGEACTGSCSFGAEVEVRRVDPVDAAVDAGP